jgi:hypothetical protein
MTGDGPNLDNFTMEQLKEMYLNVQAENRSLRELLAVSKFILHSKRFPNLYFTTQKEQKKSFDMETQADQLRQNAKEYSAIVMDLYNRLQADAGSKSRGAKKSNRE